MIMSDCDHYFHDTCVESWLAIRTHCPVCRCCITTDALIREIITMCIFNRISGFYDCQTYLDNLDIIQDTIRAITIRDVSIDIDSFNISSRIKMIDVVYERRDIICEAFNLNSTTYNILEHPIIKLYNVFTYRNVLLNNLLRKAVVMTARTYDEEDSEDESEEIEVPVIRTTAATTTATTAATTTPGMLLRGAITLFNVATRHR